MSSQFLQDKAVVNSDTGHAVVKGDQAGHAACAYHKPTLAGRDPVVVLYIPRDGTPDDLLHDFSQHWDQVCSSQDLPSRSLCRSMPHVP